jgi:hypothetical protein
MIMHLVPEGYLEALVGARLIGFCRHTLGTIYNSGRGCGYIRTHAAKFYRLATDVSGVLVLTDFRDAAAPCLPSALQAYLWNAIPSPVPSFLVRFAVNELESWLMADRQGLADFLSVSVGRIPREPELEEFPKRTLVNIARRSRKTRIRNGIAPPPGHAAAVGPAYNSLLHEFIVRHWNIAEAITCAPSLERCVGRLSQLSAG